MITPDFDGLFVVERRLRADRRLGLHRRVGERRLEALAVPVERRGATSRRDEDERRSGRPRRIHAGRLPFSPSIFPDLTV